LDTEQSVPRVTEQLIQPGTVALFTQTGVMSQVELHARAEIKWEMYTKKIQIEARVLGDLVMNHILPVASRYQSALLEKVAHFTAVFSQQEAKRLAELDYALIITLSEHLNAIRIGAEQLVEARKVANRIEEVREKALAYHDQIAPMLEEIRGHVDQLEMIVDNEIWPLPKYRELLFLR
jgi:glutamine synthetase